VFVLKGNLMIGGNALVAVGPPTFRPASPDFNPERVSFDIILDGKAWRMFRSGMPMYRMDGR